MTNYTKQEQMQIVNEINRQIGVHTLMACGARDFTFNSDEKNNVRLIFRVRSTRDKEFVSVTLDYSRDLYDIEYFKLNSKAWNKDVIAKFEDAYCDMLSGIVYDIVNKTEEFLKQE